MAKIIQFPKMERESVLIGKFNHDMVELNLSKLEAFGVSREDGVKVLRGLYRGKFFSTHAENMLTRWFFDRKWENIENKVMAA